MSFYPNPSIITLAGKKPWPTTTIMVWVHGDELFWPWALLNWLNTNPIVQTGTVFCVFANLEALDKNTRFMNINMNRCFGINHWLNCYETQRTKEIETYLNKTDLLLDLHNTIATNSIPFLISEHEKYNTFFDVEYVVSWLDIYHPGWSDWYMNTIGKIGLCFESGNLSDLEWWKRAYNAIINILALQWHIWSNTKQYKNQKKIKIYDICKNQSLKVQFTKDWKDFELIPKWTIIYYDNQIPYCAIRDSYILFKKNPNNLWDELCVLWHYYND